MNGDCDKDECENENEEKPHRAESYSGDEMPDLSFKDDFLTTQPKGNEPTREGNTNSSRKSEQNELTQIGEYLILNKIAEHGQGAVYRANHPLLNRQVVVKVSKDPADESLKQMLIEEGRALASLDHPNLAKVYDLIVENDCPCLIIEYIEGQNLEEQLSSRTFTAKESVRTITKMLDALDYVHKRGIVHRDLKPANVVTPATTGSPKIIDFGLAQTSSVYTGSAIQSSSGGTLAYMAPEQAGFFTGSPSAKCDQRSDLFGVGAILFQMLTGRRIYNFKTVSEGLSLATFCEIDFQTLDSTDLPESLKAVCRKALSQDPANRFQTASEFAQALETVFPNESEKRNLLPIIGSVVGLIALISVIALFVWNPLGDDKNQPKVSNALSLAEFLPGIELNHHALSSGEILKDDLFKNGQVHEDDEMRIKLSFDEPSYCFLFSINPDGTTQLCFPEDQPDLVQMEPISTVAYPEDKTLGYAFTEGPGQVAFFVVQSTIPLPAFNQWIAQHDDLVEPVMNTTGSWIWQDDKFTLASDLISVPESRDIRGKRKLTTPRELEERIKQITDDKLVKVRIITFPVKAIN